MLSIRQVLQVSSVDHDTTCARACHISLCQRARGCVHMGMCECVRVQKAKRAGKAGRQSLRSREKQSKRRDKSAWQEGIGIEYAIQAKRTLQRTTAQHLPADPSEAALASSSLPCNSRPSSPAPSAASVTLVVSLLLRRVLPSSFSLESLPSAARRTSA
jgi:hypothetical protein